VTVLTRQARVNRGTRAQAQAPKRVQVYWNLNKAKQGEFVFSVRHRGKVIGYAGLVYLRNCRFHVNPDHSARIKEGHKRSVHAWVSGDMVNKGESMSETGFTPVNLRAATYNPHRDSSFVDCGTGKPVHSADLVCCVAEVSDKGGKGRVYYV
tara:strand:- start:47 stop:502 length:456 start_codon:yes stop_codon:yes gene_type:complete